MRRGSRLGTALSLLLVGCTSNGYAPLSHPKSLVASDGVAMLDDEDGDPLPVTPDSRVSFDTEHGWTRTQTAGDLCRRETDLAVRVGKTCEGAIPLVPYSEIKGVEVDTFDRAGTVAIVSAVSAVVLAVLAVVIGAASKGSSGGSGGGGGKSTGSSKGALTVLPSTGGGGRSLYGSTYDGTGLNVFVNAVGGPAGPAPQERPDPLPEMRDNGIGPSFSRYEVRRAALGVLASADVTASAFGRDGVSSGFHGGIRVDDFADLQVGARLLGGGRSLDSPRVVPTAKIGLHGEFPRARWIALGLSFEGGAGSAVDLYLDARFGLRFEPFRGFWIGVYPVHPTYLKWSQERGDHWIAASSVDLAFGF